MAVAGRPAPKHVTKPGVFVIDSDVGEVFEQAAATVRAPLSSDAAWRLFAGLNGSARRVPPHFVTVRLGYLTLPVGLGMPDTAHHELSWAYSWRQCMASRGLYVTTPPPPPRSCVSWLFLDGTTGAQIDMTQQH